MKKLYKVKASYVSYCHAEVLAEDSEQAIDIARDMDGGDFTPDTSMHNGEWTIEDAIPMTKQITICGSYGEFKVDATTGKIKHRNHSDEYDMIKHFNMPETLSNVDDTLEDITADYSLDIILCGYTCFDGTVEPPMPPEEKIAVRERAIAGIDADKNEYKGMSFVTGYSSTSDDGNHMDTIAMDDEIYIQITGGKITVYKSNQFIEIGHIYLNEPLMAGSLSGFNFIEEFMNENTGGGCMVDVLMLADGRYIGITDEVICLYPPVTPIDGLPINCSDDYLMEDIGNVSLI